MSHNEPGPFSVRIQNNTYFHIIFLTFCFENSWYLIFGMNGSRDSGIDIGISNS